MIYQIEDLVNLAIADSIVLQFDEPGKAETVDQLDGKVGSFVWGALEEVSEVKGLEEPVLNRVFSLHLGFEGNAIVFVFVGDFPG
jgi:hypothetical protein